MNDKKIFNLSYEDTDKNYEIKIYDIDFKFNVSKVNELMKINKNDEKALDEAINILLGEDAVDKINKKRVLDGHQEMDLLIKSGVLGFLYETYSELMIGSSVDKIGKSINKVNEKINSYNREQRRFNNKRYRRY